LTPDFSPLFRNSHLATVAGNYWHRQIDEARFPPARVEYCVAPQVTVVAYEHQPTQRPAYGQIVLLHGLEGSSNGGYILSFAQAALDLGFGVHRLNMRSCGGTEHLSATMYHSGLTSDTLQVLNALQARNVGPLFLVGFSLGGNVALKLAGELRRTELLSGVCAVSTPIDLACAVRAIDKPENIFYGRRFLSRLKARIRRKSVSAPHLYSTAALKHVRSIWAFDDLYTAPLFGFGTAENYYATQSSGRFLEYIEVPTLIVIAQDDPMVPFEMYRRSVFEDNPALTLVAPKFGGHLGFLSRTRPRFWLDELLMHWITDRVALTSGATAAGPAYLD
jgi:predicted alpha/beta-fold hydrolase